MSDKIEGDLSCGELGWEVLRGEWGSGLCSFWFGFSADSRSEAARFLICWLSCGDWSSARASAILSDKFSLW